MVDSRLWAWTLPGQLHQHPARHWLAQVSGALFLLFELPGLLWECHLKVQQWKVPHHALQLQCSHGLFSWDYPALLMTEVDLSPFSPHGLRPISCHFGVILLNQTSTVATCFFLFPAVLLVTFILSSCLALCLYIATYTQIQPHSLIQQQQQIHLQKQVVIQQQIAIHHQQQFQHRQSQLLHTATHLQLAQQQQQSSSLTQQQQAQPPQQQAPPQNQQQTQTLVVQPMLQSQPQSVQLQHDSPSQPATKSPVPIQSKSMVTIKPPQLGPAKMSAAQQPPPHIPVQVVGTRQQGSGQAQALGIAQIAAAVPTSRGMPAVVQSVSQAHAPSPPSSAPVSSQEAPPLTTGVNLAQVQGTTHMVKNPTSSPVVAQMPTAFYMQSLQLPVSQESEYRMDSLCAVQGR